MIHGDSSAGLVRRTLGVRAGALVDGAVRLRGSFDGAGRAQLDLRSAHRTWLAVEVHLIPPSALDRLAPEVPRARALTRREPRAGPPYERQDEGERQRGCQRSAPRAARCE